MNPAPLAEGEVPGLVTGIGARDVEVHVEAVGTVRCSLRGKLWGRDDEQSRPLAVGDRVTLEIERGPDIAAADVMLGPDGTPGAPPEPHGVIRSVAERTNELARMRGGRKRGARQVIAANLDRLVIVAALIDPPFRAGLVDRFLVACGVRGIDPLLVINKVDLGVSRGPDAPPQPGLEAAEALAAPYREAGVDVLLCSANDGTGIDALRDTLTHGVHLLMGHSGVGKSSLLNAVAPSLALDTGVVADYHGRGKHTTTRVCLRPLPADDGVHGWVVDSPGLREFGLLDVETTDAARLFPGLGDLPDRCKFRNCLHLKEPGCAVLAAVESGDFPAERHKGYLRMLEELDQPIEW